jgi:glycosyltransferase involved in cell wall biosynthesis
MIVSGLIGFFPILLKKLGLIRKPIIYYWGDYFHEAMGKRWSVDKCAYMEFFCVKNASFVTTPSRFLEVVCSILGIKCKYIPHGVVDDINKVKENPLKELGREQKKLLKLIQIGDIDRYKRVDEIIKAVKDKKCVLYLIGKTFDKKIVENLPKNVIYLKEMPHKDVLSYLKACDIAVITSDQDSTLKMFEYLALGKPILAFNGRINYVLTHGENAYLTSDFSKAVNDLIKNKKILGKISKNARKFKVHKWEKMVRVYEDVIMKLTKKNG